MAEILCALLVARKHKKVHAIIVTIKTHMPCKTKQMSSSGFSLSFKVGGSPIVGMRKREFSMTNEIAFHLLDNKLCHFH